MTAATDTYFPVGMVTRPHGVRGDVRIHSVMSDPQLLRTAKMIRATYSDGRVKDLEVGETRIQGQSVLLHFRQIDDRQSAEQLRGAQLDVARSELPPLAKNEYYLGDLVGYLVVTEVGEEIGKITQAWDLPANDVIEVCRDNRVVLIPLVEEMIREIDHTVRRVMVSPVDGLLE
jgi:16S rRNA processing protein RimM